MSAKADKTGSCSFCGQTKIIQVPEEWEQGQINEAVTCECECEQAQAYAKAKERKDKAKKPGTRSESSINNTEHDSSFIAFTHRAQKGATKRSDATSLFATSLV